MIRQRIVRTVEQVLGLRSLDGKKESLDRELDICTRVYERDRAQQAEQLELQVTALQTQVAEHKKTIADMRVYLERAARELRGEFAADVKKEGLI